MLHRLSSNFLKMLRLVLSIVLRSAAEQAEWLEATWRKPATADPRALVFTFIIRDSSHGPIDLDIQMGLSRRCATSFFTSLVIRCLAR
jgi:hypothetical protein